MCRCYLLLQVFVGRVSILWVVEFLLEDRVRQNTVLHITLQSYNNNKSTTSNKQQQINNIKQTTTDDPHDLRPPGVP